MIQDQRLGLLNTGSSQILVELCGRKAQCIDASEDATRCKSVDMANKHPSIFPAFFSHFCLYRPTPSYVHTTDFPLASCLPFARRTPRLL